MSDLEARIAEVLATADKAHAFRMADYSDSERPIYRCACGVESIGMHHEHHREALTAALLPMVREREAEALREAADWLTDMSSGYRRGSGQLLAGRDIIAQIRARADNLEKP